MAWEQGFVLALLALIIVSLLASKLKPSVIFAGAAFIAFMLGMIDLPSLAKNFTNSSLLTLVLLILSSCALEKTRLISWVGRHISEGRLGSVVGKLGLSTAILSSFTNNTAVVVSLIGAIKRNQRHAPSRLLIPLSYAAILGGTLTLIGTSTNLIINSFVEDAGLPSLSFFAPTTIGIAVLLGGLFILIPLSYLLPQYDEGHQDELPYFLEARVEGGSPLVGKSIAENNLRALRKLFLAEVIREGKTIVSVDPEMVLLAGDRLLFCGDIESVTTLQEINGLTLFGQHHLNGQNLIEVVVSQSASIRGKSIKSSKFRDRFDAVVVAIRRGHERLEGGLGKIELQAGDTLVLVPGKDFEQSKQQLKREFVIISDLDSAAKLDGDKSALVLLGFAGVIAAELLNIFPIIKGLSVYLLALLALGVINIGELRRRFPIDIVVIVGAALSIAQLMLSSGLSVQLGNMFMELFNGWGVIGALIAVYLITLVLTELITNNAAAALAFPIGYSMALGYGVDPMPFIMAVLFGASASFISPYGYQTNLLVFSVGNYTLLDYVKVGLPMSIIYSVLVLTLIPYFFPF
ncbi:SLC13 family permease [Aliivibrio finisterrensis]|uniref:SLC13 family permease n=1 Tax=Aliivibrio finisterrensis TaxID=511998 RepID=A0A6N6RQU2_9GAMM|nr:MULTISPECIES: SLC13 family permease [Aliivibrio]KAB2823818.1 SLC13 family permease [Aliivibrio finisterrensis]MDD9176795.1 SLC13 family permease [Aliivibrio sp. S3TY1]MDD9193873.1 SLC13 family permease [Aliivibrio sp. S2TY2]RYU66017.1 SLC13 family permease [Aliivibrio finisterrensis]RYU69358.1 SLC13 family permease [Aliivibrio finisterrensis]